MIDILPRKGPKAMEAFIVALLETGQAHIADRIEKDLADEWRKNNPNKSDKEEITTHKEDKTHSTPANCDETENNPGVF